MTQYDVELINVVKEFTTSRNQTFRAVDSINIQIKRGEFFALLGPSGCGKTTSLRMIAGFEQPSSGELLIRGTPMQGIPAFHRPVNTVFQDYALFPHMTILKNVMFGLTMEGVKKNEARERALEALELVRLPQVADRKPNQLSGGQQQRIALARALVKKPAVLLLDEPLGALDLKLRKAMQYELKEMQQEVGITFIYVTHDQEEAMTMADRIAVMSDGHVLQIGTPKEIYERPNSYFVADFIGETNFIRGTLENVNGKIGTVRLSEDTTIFCTLPDNTTVHKGEVSMPIRPERIGIAADREHIPTDANLTVIEGVIENSQYIGTDTRYSIRIAGNNEIIARVQNIDYGSPYPFEIGQKIIVFWSIDSTYVLDH
ncbi:ABC transporter ATP-binding protein [Anaerolineales bacterium]